MKHNRIKNATARRWELLESYDRYHLFVSGNWEISLIWDDGGGDVSIINRFRGRYAAEEAFDAWYDLIGD